MRIAHILNRTATLIGAVIRAWHGRGGRPPFIRESGGGTYLYSKLEVSHLPRGTSCSSIDRCSLEEGDSRASPRALSQGLSFSWRIWFCRWSAGRFERSPPKCGVTTVAAFESSSRSAPCLRPAFRANSAPDGRPPFGTGRMFAGSPGCSQQPGRPASPFSPQRRWALCKLVCSAMVQVARRWTTGTFRRILLNREGPRRNFNDNQDHCRLSRAPAYRPSSRGHLAAPGLGLPCEYQARPAAGLLAGLHRSAAGGHIVPWCLARPPAAAGSS